VLQAAACRWFQLPFASDCAFDVLRGVFYRSSMVGIGESFEALSVVGFDPRRTSTLRRCLATGLALHRYGLWSLRLPKPFATPLKKAERGILPFCFIGLSPRFAARPLGHPRYDGWFFSGASVCTVGESFGWSTSIDSVPPSPLTLGGPLRSRRPVSARSLRCGLRSSFLVTPPSLRSVATTRRDRRRHRSFLPCLPCRSRRAVSCHRA